MFKKLQKHKENLMTLYDRVERFFWLIIRPIHPYVKNFLLHLHVIHHKGRQKYLLGKLAPGVTAEQFYHHLHKSKFRKCLITWIDDGEIMNLRRWDGFHYQYHLRLFVDGEIRGHYETTPEAHPIAHMKERDMQVHREDFLGFLGDYIIPSATASSACQRQNKHGCLRTEHT